MLIKISRKIRRKLYPDPDLMVAKQWRQDRGDQTLRLNYDLNESSVVLDAGGFEGQWASDIYARFNCRVHIFEPVRHFAESIERRFSENRNIRVHPFGVGGFTRTERCAVFGDSSSLYRDGVESESVSIVDVVEWLDSSRIGKVDLLKINIEGGEYELMERLVESGYIERIDHIQVQFHRLDSTSERRMEQVLASLSDTHEPAFRYRFVWESWHRKAA